MPRGRPKKNPGKSVQNIPTQYDFAQTVEEIAKQLIGKFHKHLVNCKIAYLFKNKPMKSRGRDVFATAEKVSAKNHALSGYHFLITVAYPTWNNLPDEQKIAVIDHELEHCFVDDDEKTGEPKYQIVPHDVEEFSSVILRHGLYTTGLVKLGHVVSELPADSKNEPMHILVPQEPKKLTEEDEIFEEAEKSAKKPEKVKVVEQEDSEEEIFEEEEESDEQEESEEDDLFADEEDKTEKYKKPPMKLPKMTWATKADEDIFADEEPPNYLEMSDEEEAEYDRKELERKKKRDEAKEEFQKQRLREQYKDDPKILKMIDEGKVGVLECGNYIPEIDGDWYHKGLTDKQRYEFERRALKHQQQARSRTSVKTPVEEDDGDSMWDIKEDDEEWV